MAEDQNKRNSSASNLPTSGFCYTCFQAVKWVPVIFIVAVISWSYYAYVVQLCFFSVDSLPEKILYLFFYHIIFFMFVWSYWQTVFTAIGRVPPKFRIPRKDIERLTKAENQESQKRILEAFASNLPISNRTITGALRYCDKCMSLKPDRAHHCSVCGTCVLKMDHHCPWVNNCVNFTNYKYFVLFLGYAFVYCIFVALTVLKYFILFWEGNLDGGVGRFHLLFLFFVAVMFAISLVSLFGYHLYLVALNRTTLESFRTPIFRIGGPDKNGFNLGRYNNVQEVFGDDKRMWLLPVFSSLGDGIQYPIQINHLPEHGNNQMNYLSMGTTAVPVMSMDTTNDPLPKLDKENDHVADIELGRNSIDEETGFLGLLQKKEIISMINERNNENDENSSL